MTTYSKGLEPYKHDIPYDPNSKAFYYKAYRPQTRLGAFEYMEGDHADYVLPPVDNGFMYVCVSGGISAAIAPTFIAIKGKITVDGTVKWQAIPYDMLLLSGDSITASAWSGSGGETISSESIVAGSITKFRLDGVVSGSKKATVINHITVLRANGDVEEFDSTLIITIKEL